MVVSGVPRRLVPLPNSAAHTCALAAAVQALLAVDVPLEGASLAWNAFRLLSGYGCLVDRVSLDECVTYLAQLCHAGDGAFHPVELVYSSLCDVLATDSHAFSPYARARYSNVETCLECGVEIVTAVATWLLEFELEYPLG